MPLLTRTWWPGLLLGIGLGGFVDGILLHQILQWHHMLTAEGCCPSSTVGGLEDNTLADGLFHLATLIALGVGLWMVIGDWRRRGLPPTHRDVIGLAMVGWGLFNLVEGVVDHHILVLHHVRDDVSQKLPWDLGFLAFGFALMVVGVVVARRGDRDEWSARTTPN
jgi:uncharacterized membrane protein